MFGKKIDNGDVIGNIDLSILNVFCNSYLIHTSKFKIFDNWTQVPPYRVARLFKTQLDKHCPEERSKNETQ